MDIDAVVSSLTERDKWRRRLAVLRQSLGEVRARRGHWEERLKRLDADLHRLMDYSEGLFDAAPRGARARGDGAAGR